MKTTEKFEKKFSSLLYNHIWLKVILENAFAVLATVISAAIFAFGLNTFLEPSVLGGAASALRPMVSGGSSGAAQVFNLLFTINNAQIEGKASLIFSLFYFGINIPLIILAFKGIGKRFGAYTLLNVGLVFLFTNTMHGSFFETIAIFINDECGLLGRALFAGMCTGLSSAIAFKIDTSAGGMDIITYYISNKKSTTVGKYGMVINGVIVGSFSLISGVSTHSYAIAFSGVFFSLIYLLTVMLVIDVINIRNKKAQIQIISHNKELPKLLIANIPHGATAVDAKGVYTDSDRLIIYMVVSTTEVKHAIKVIKELDPESFIGVTSLQSVVGNFHMKPIK